MFLNTFSRCLSRFGVNVFPWQRIIVILCFSMLGGCATEPPILHAIGDQAVLPVPAVGKAAYNKPYRVKGKAYAPLRTASGYKAKGVASWYGSESGNRTASGVRFDPNGLTAAHKTLPIPSKVRVTNLRNGRHVDVVINDRGPFSSNRLIDLSKGAAEHIGMSGLTEVTVEYLDG